MRRLPRCKVTVQSGIMLPDTCIVVPTYWTRAGGTPRPGDAVYDHPTPLDGDSTLGPLMESLQSLEGEFYLLLIVAVTGEDVSAAADARVTDLISKYPSVQTLTFGSDTLRTL